MVFLDEHGLDFHRRELGRDHCGEDYRALKYRLSFRVNVRIEVEKDCIESSIVEVIQTIMKHAYS